MLKIDQTANNVCTVAKQYGISGNRIFTSHKQFQKSGLAVRASEEIEPVRGSKAVLNCIRELERQLGKMDGPEILKEASQVGK